MHGLGQLLLHKMAGLGFILASPVHLALEHVHLALSLGEVQEVCAVFLTEHDYQTGF